MFVLAKELVGVPGLPKTIKGIREALRRYCGESEGMMRKRAGTKAFEFHVAYFHERRSLNNFHRDRVITFEQIAE